MGLHTQAVIEGVDGSYHIYMFPNSWAAEDYQGLLDEPSTMVTMDVADESEALMRAITLPSHAWFRTHDQEPQSEAGRAEQHECD